MQIWRCQKGPQQYLFIFSFKIRRVRKNQRPERENERAGEREETGISKKYKEKNEIQTKTDRKVQQRKFTYLQ